MIKAKKILDRAIIEVVEFEAETGTYHVLWCVRVRHLLIGGILLALAARACRLLDL